MTPTLQKQKALIDGGFTEQEISDWQVEQRRALGDAGFNQAEIDTEFGEQVEYSHGLGLEVASHLRELQ